MYSKIFKFGDNVNTDEIISGQYNMTTDSRELAKHCLEVLNPDFYSLLKEGDIIVAGENFGCGSSREHAPIAIKASGIKAVVAKSFARIFYRNAINIGLPIFVCSSLYTKIKDGDSADIDIKKGEILYKRENYKTDKFPKFIMDIFKAGGIVNYFKKNSLHSLDISHS